MMLHFMYATVNTIILHSDLKTMARVYSRAICKADETSLGFIMTTL